MEYIYSVVKFSIPQHDSGIYEYLTRFDNVCDAIEYRKNLEENNSDDSNIYVIDVRTK